LRLFPNPGNKDAIAKEEDIDFVRKMLKLYFYLRFKTSSFWQKADAFGRFKRKLRLS